MSGARERKIDLENYGRWGNGAKVRTECLIENSKESALHEAYHGL